MSVQRLVVTPGEPAGIGPDLVVRMAQRAHECELVAIADPDLLRERARAIGLDVTLEAVDYSQAPRPQAAGTLTVDAVLTHSPVTAGTLDAANARYVLDTLDRAVERCQQGVAAGMVTGPVHKAIINQAGITFSGHTGYLADRCGSGPPVMMLATDDGALRVALVSVHLPLSAVPGAITAQAIAHTLDVMHNQMSARFGIEQPRILVAGLNPHAGEDGYLGREEIEVIQPALEAARRRGIDALGPLPADTLFTPEKLARADAILAMYHDQGLPVIKHLGFGRTVNISLGLPIIRTSVDHGTALALAGSNSVDTGSMQAAIQIALDMARQSKPLTA